MLYINTKKYSAIRKTEFSRLVFLVKLKIVIQTEIIQKQKVNIFLLIYRCYF